MEPLVVLIVDHDDTQRRETVDLVETEMAPVTVLPAGTVAEALDIVASESVDVLVTGYNFEEGNGLALAESVREKSPHTGCILYTTSETVDTVSFEDVVVEFVGKEQPDAEETLLALVHQTGPELTQAPYPVPADEPERLDEAETVLETGPEVSAPLERIATLAREYFDSESAAVTLVLRERQELLAQAGISMTPTNREDSLATHSIASPDVVAVEDTRTDPRFEDVDAIQSAGIVSYLGAVVRSPAGGAVGVLGVYDDEPRQFSETDHQYLDQLAAVVTDIFALTQGEQV